MKLTKSMKKLKKQKEDNLSIDITTKKGISINISQTRNDANNYPFPTDWAKGPAMNYYQKLEKKIESMIKKTESAWKNTIVEILKLEGFEDSSLSDSPMDELDRTLNRLYEESLKEEFSDKFVESAARDFVSQTEQYATTQFKQQIHSITGINPFLGQSNELNRAFRNHVRDNVSLIKTIPQKYHEDVERAVRDGMMRGESIGEMAERIDKAGRRTTNNARLIARDQSGKIMGNMTKVRHKQVGLKKFRWVDVGDSRVRPRHLEYSDNVYTWKEGAGGGTWPGFEIQCRCVAVPVEAEIKNKFGEGSERPPNMPENLNTASEEYVNMNPRIRDSFNKDGSFNYSAHREAVRTYNTPYDKYTYKMDVVDELMYKKLGVTSLDDISAAKFKYKEAYEGRGIKFKLQGETMDISKQSDMAKWIFRFEDAEDITKQRKILTDFIDDIKNISNVKEKKAMARLSNKFSRNIQRQKVKGIDLSQVQPRDIDDMLKAYSGKGVKPKEMYSKIRAMEGKSYAHDSVDDAVDWYSKRMRRTNVALDNPPLIDIDRLTRASFDHKDNIMYLGRTSNSTTVVHEFGHSMHKVTDETQDMISTWFARRTEDSVASQITSGEWGYKDKFIDHYVGKVYGVMEKGEEVFSMGAQYMYSNPVSFLVDDPNHFKLTFSIMAGL